jgi:predicted AlkP superfamily phosphohydrolase/phosphomutase
VREELATLLSTLSLPGGPTLTNEVFRPEQTYRQVRGTPPDLLVVFDDLRWRSLGSVGHGNVWMQGNDRGVDEANHAWDGLFVLWGDGIEAGRRRASILDIAPTALDWLGLPAPADLSGRSLLHGSVLTSPVGPLAPSNTDNGLDPIHEAQLVERLRELYGD